MSIIYKSILVRTYGSEFPDLNLNSFIVLIVPNLYQWHQTQFLINVFVKLISRGNASTMTTAFWSKVIRQMNF